MMRRRSFALCAILIVACSEIPSVVCDSLVPKDQGAVEIWTEITSTSDETTFVVREVFDSQRNAALLQYSQNGKTETLLMDRKLDRLFQYNDDECKSMNLTEAENLYRNVRFMKWIRFNNIPTSFGFLGPANWIENFEQTAKKVDPTPENCTNDRSIPCVTYKTQLEGVTLEFAYSEPSNTIFGRNESLPIRYVVEGTPVEVFSIKPYDVNKTLDLFVPTGRSCEVQDDLAELVLYSSPTFEFEAEVVLTNHQENRTYVSQMSGVAANIVSLQNDSPDLFSFSYSLWEMSRDLSGYEIGSKERVIFDRQRNFFYLHEFSKDSRKTGVNQMQCEKHHEATDKLPYLPLPFYGQFDLTPLFLKAPKRSEAKISHLGPNRIRGADADVYEATYDNFYTGTDTLYKLVVTYYFDVYLGYPLAVELRGMNESSIMFTVQINVAMFNIDVRGLNEKLNVEDCYDDWGSSYSKWLQVGFQVVNRDDFELTKTATPLIKEAFLNSLYKVFNLSPMRVPHVSVDFVAEQVRVNALILEMLNIDQHFQSIYSKDLRYSTPIGILSRQECQARCLGMSENECTGLSYCGSVCSVTNARNVLSTVNLKSDTFCVVDSRLMNETAHVTTAQILRNIKKSVETTNENEKFVFSLNIVRDDGDYSVTLEADSVDDSKDFDTAFHYEKGRNPIIEMSFQIAQPRKRFVAGPTAKNNKLLGSLAIDDCAVACRNRADCESFSFCSNSRDCVISANHEIASTSTEDDVNCIVYQIKYTDRFDKLPGLTIKSEEASTVVMNEESCAQKCLAKDDCKSFEFCSEEGNCYILGKHMSDIGRNARESESSCTHYSKKFLFDYNKQASARGDDPSSSTLADFANITEAECAKRCTEWPNELVCMSFDFCGRQTDNTGSCTLRTMNGNGKTTSVATCDFYSVKKPKPFLVSMHSAGGVFGLSLLMLILGVGLGFAGFTVYTKYFM